MTGKQDASDPSVKCPIFNGDKQQWSVWKDKFEARAARLGYDGILDGTTVIPSTPTTDEQKRIVELAKRAYSDLLLAINNKMTEGFIAFTTVKDPTKNARNAWERLCKKYSPTTLPLRQSLKKTFNTSKLRKGHNPAHFVLFLQNIRFQLDQTQGQKVTDKDLFD